MSRFGIVLVVLILIGAPAYARSSSEAPPADIAQADTDRRAVARRLVDVTTEYDENITRAEILQTELQRLAVELTVRENQLAATRAAAVVVTRERYMSGRGTDALAMFAASSLTELRVRGQYLDLFASNDVATLKRLEALQENYLQQQVRLDAAVSEQDQVTALLELLAGRIIGELQAANDAYDSALAEFARQEEERQLRRAEAERRRIDEEAAAAARSASSTTSASTTPTATIPPQVVSTTVAPSTTTTGVATSTTTTIPPSPPASGSRTCPVDGASSFVDSFGAPRSGGRTHQGIDMIAARGTPLVAIEEGVVFRISTGGRGGVTVWLRTGNGDEYFYGHLDAWAPGLSVGRHLDLGELLGTVGSTGNARYTVPHLHFEYHPGGGSAVNPYSLVADLCL